MTKNELFETNDKKFLPLGFKKDEHDPMFYYSKSLIEQSLIDENEMDDEDVPQLLYGTTGINTGFCIYTGYHFVWLNCTTPEEAISVAEKIVAFEEC
jgi:hypothetical protein